MNIVIVGLGLIGASFAKAFKMYTSHYIIGIDTDLEVLHSALKNNVIDKIGTSQSITDADIIYLCIYPEDAINFIEENKKYIPPECIVTDTCGIKHKLCSRLSKLAYGNFKFLGSHPMAGKEKNGFLESSHDLFKGASYIITPCEAPDEAVNIIKELAFKIGFGEIKITTPEEHDRMIAFTSQLPHVLACAYVLSPRCKKHNGFSAGSYRDVSRVARINETLWSELFISNKEPLVSEINLLINNLTDIRNYIENEDIEKLKETLKTGRNIKEELGE